MTAMRKKLEELGLRVEGDFTLSSGIHSHVKWDIEKLFNYPTWVQEKAIEEWLWMLGMICPKQLIGLRRGGFYLATIAGSALQVRSSDSDHTYVWHRPCILIDDVLTTGNTITKWITEEDSKGNRCFPFSGEWNPDYIAVLINRSSITEINGIPIITGIFADPIEPNWQENK